MDIVKEIVDFCSIDKGRYLPLLFYYDLPLKTMLITKCFLEFI